MRPDTLALREAADILMGRQAARKRSRLFRWMQREGFAQTDTDIAIRVLLREAAQDTITAATALIDEIQAGEGQV